jgi:hypothetical protein
MTPGVTGAGLTDYEQQRIDEIAAWKAESPTWAARALRTLRGPLGRLGSAVIPDVALKGALARLDATLDTDRQVREFLESSGAAAVERLRDGPLETCDRLAERYGVRAERQALGLGAVAGAGGLVTELVGIPVLLAAALRSIHRTGLSYGYRLDAPADRSYLKGVLELSTVDDPARRQAVRGHLARIASGQERPLEPPIGLGGVERGVAADLALEAVPLVGDPVTLVLDYTMMKRVDRTARMVFRERWLRDSGRVTGEIPPAAAHRRADALRDVRDLAAQTAYLAGYGVGFAVTLPAAALGRVAGRLPGPVTRGVRDGARDASRSVDEFCAGWHVTSSPAAVRAAAGGTGP